MVEMDRAVMPMSDRPTIVKQEEIGLPPAFW